MKLERRTKLFLLTFVFIVLVGTVIIRINSFSKQDRLTASGYDQVVSNAQVLYRKAVQEGRDLSSGPCLTNDLMPGWVVDIVHSPRQSIDDLVQNQCAAYQEGRATHFVELDQGGNLVRLK